MVEPPRRLAVGDDDFPLWLYRGVNVMLDGQEIAQAIAYDMDAGTVLRHRTDEQGLVILNAEGDEVEIETLTGNVTVSLDHPD